MSDQPAGGVARRSFTVRGVVQGVGFRWFVVQEASRLGLVGWVANGPDGSVAIEAEGSLASLDRLAALLREGPPGAVVREVAEGAMEPLGTEGRFEVRAMGHRGD